MTYHGRVVVGLLVGSLVSSLAIPPPVEALRQQAIVEHAGLEDLHEGLEDEVSGPLAWFRRTMQRVIDATRQVQTGPPPPGIARMDRRQFLRLAGGAAASLAVPPEIAAEAIEALGPTPTVLVPSELWLAYLQPENVDNFQRFAALNSEVSYAIERIDMYGTTDIDYRIVKLVEAIRALSEEDSFPTLLPNEEEQQHLEGHLGFVEEVPSEFDVLVGGTRWKYHEFLQGVGVTHANEILAKLPWIEAWLTQRGISGDPRDPTAQANFYRAVARRFYLVRTTMRWIAQMLPQYRQNLQALSDLAPAYRGRLVLERLLEEGAGFVEQDPWFQAARRYAELRDRYRPYGLKSSDEEEIAWRKAEIDELEDQLQREFWLVDEQSAASLTVALVRRPLVEELIGALARATARGPIEMTIGWRGAEGPPNVWLELDGSLDASPLWYGEAVAQFARGTEPPGGSTTQVVLHRDSAPLQVIAQLERALDAGWIRFASGASQPESVGFLVQDEGLPYAALFARAVAQGYSVPFAGLATHARIQELVEGLSQDAGAVIRQRIVAVDGLTEPEARRRADHLLREQLHDDPLARVVEVREVWQEQLWAQVYAYLRYTALRFDSLEDEHRALALLQAA